jgi:hypothetical protein
MALGIYLGDSAHLAHLMDGDLIWKTPCKLLGFQQFAGANNLCPYEISIYKLQD